MPVEKPQQADRSAPEPPPPLGSWNRVYFAVLAHLVFLILLFRLFSTAFS